ncbi:MAG: response regulator [Pseudomonadota bacterium]
MAAEKSSLKTKVMLVEPSATMRYVLQNYCEKSEYDTESFSSFDRALEALKSQYQSFELEYRCVILGWPNVPATGADEFFELLESADYHDLPVIVLAQDLRADARAWVAGRSHTVLVRWKEYRTIIDLVSRLLDQDIAADDEAFPAKFSNNDINILVIDDSPSIRYALSDLLNLQGYNVDVVGTVEQGLESARAGSYDIAVIDYYLQESTGDELCRQLMSEPQTSDITCAILTGTYSDHIIKRSLRAGAVECMFKNESSELLLARIDAISRMVRNKKQLKEDHLRLDAILGSVKDGVYGVDHDGNITFVNSRAKSLLGYPDDEDFGGKSAHELFHHSDANGLPIAAKNCQIQRAYEHGVAVQNMDGIFFDYKGRVVNVVYTIRPLIVQNKEAGSIVEFSKREQNAVLDPSTWRYLAYDNISGLMNRRHFESCLENEINRVKRTQAKYSLLVITVDFAAYGGRSVNISTSAALVKAVSKLLVRRFRNTDLMGYLGDGQFGLILSHTTVDDAYLVTRKLTQAITALSKKLKNSRIDCSGGLISIGRTNSFGPTELISKAQLGCQIAKRKGRNYTFVCDINQVIPCFSTLDGKRMVSTVKIPPGAVLN